MKKIILTLLIGLYAPIHSMNVVAQQNAQETSSTDIQSIQTRTYDKPYKDVFRSVVSVLQDNKYKIGGADIHSGVITAYGTPQLSENMHSGVAFIPFVGGLLSMARETKTEQWTMSGTVEEINAKSTKVRLVLTSDKTKNNMFSSAADTLKNDDLTGSPEIYQDLFTKIDKALFLREATK
jgi:hypothetical protein